MNKKERIKMVKAMEYIARQVNDEYNFEYWLSLGVADEDIPYGDLSDDSIDPYYIEDEEFSDLMFRFLCLMHMVHHSGKGGLTCDGVLSK